MALSVLVEGDVQVSLLATSGHAGLAVDMLADRFGLSRQYAETVLDQGYGVLMARVDAADARDAAPLLATLGLRVVIQPLESLPPDEFCDVSVRLTDSNSAPKLIAALERMMGATGLDGRSFDGPSGLVLSTLSPARAEWLCAALRRIAGVYVMVSEHRSARYDLFAQSGLTDSEDTEVRRFLRLLGCTTGGIGDAVGSGMDRRVLDRVLARFGDLDLVGVNQVFQRYELLIIGKGTLTLPEFADFLMTRPAAQSIPMRNLMEALPLRIEPCLTRTAAKQFLADYCAIGMQTITRLVWSTNRAA